MISILEIDKVIIKTYNAMVINFLDTEKSKIDKFLNSQDTQIFEENEHWQEQQNTLMYIMTFLRESLKYILFSFLKRCRIIISLLVKIKKHFQKETNESIIAEMLASNFRWSFKTILTCIDKSRKNSYDREPSNNDTGIN